MEQIRSGQTFLFRENGYDSTVLEICMKDTIRGDYLQVAVSRATKRFPYLTQKLVEKDGCYFLHKNDISVNAVSTKKLRSLGSMPTGYHLIDITFTKNDIRIAFHHALCDGRGIKPFVETLIYYYCCLKYKKTFSSDGIHTDEECIDSFETTEPFGKEQISFDETLVTKVNSKGFRLPETTATPDCCYRTTIKFNEKVFVEYAKRLGATPGILASVLLSTAIYRLYPDIDTPIVCGMAIDLRFAVGMENTHRNCTGSIYFPYSKEENKLTMTELCIEYRKMLASQKTIDSAKSKINDQINLFNMIDSIDTLDNKRKKLRFLENASSSTYVISYLGKMNFNDFNTHVESAHFYTQGIKGLTVNMISAGETLSFDILQGFDGDLYVNELLEILDKHKLSYELGQTKAVVTGTDKSYITASRQAERYYIK